MAPKPPRRNTVDPKAKDLSNLSLSDVICPICLCILIEPVCMPCNHMLCSPCFQDTLDQAALQCPLCRTRISIWVRKATKEGTLVNQKVWKWIQENYEHKVYARLNNIEESDEEYAGERNNAPIKTCNTGEIRKEYEEELRRALKERDKEQREQENASKELITRLRMEQEKELLEEELASKQLILKLSKEDDDLDQSIIVDKELAREVRRQLHFTSPTPSGKQGPMDLFIGSSTKVAKKRRKIANLLDAKRQSLMDITHSSSSEDNSDEVIKPKKTKTRKIDKENINNRGLINNNNKNNNNKMKLRKPNITRIQYDTDDTDSESYDENLWFKNKQRKRDAGRPKVQDTTVEMVQGPSTSEDCNLTVADLNAVLPQDAADTLTFDELIEQQKQYEARLRQEREDHKLALLLQREMKQIDRRKGSGDEYKLRQRVGEPSTSVEGRTSGQRNIAASNKSASKVKKPLAKDKGRQTTLFESLSKTKKK